MSSSRTDKFSSMMRGAAIGASIGALTGDLYGMATTPDDAGFVQENIRPYAYAGLGGLLGGMTGGAIGGGKAILKTLPFVLPAAAILGFGGYTTYQKGREELENEVHSPGDLVDWAFGTKKSSFEEFLLKDTAREARTHDLLELTKTSASRGSLRRAWDRLGRVGSDSRIEDTGLRHLLLPKKYTSERGIWGLIDNLKHNVDSEYWSGTASEGWRGAGTGAAVMGTLGGLGGLVASDFIGGKDDIPEEIQGLPGGVSKGMLLGGFGAALGALSGVGTGYQVGRWTGGARRMIPRHGGVGPWLKDLGARTGRGAITAAAFPAVALAAVLARDKLETAGLLDPGEGVNKTSSLIPAALLGAAGGAAGILGVNAAKKDRPSEGLALGAGAGAAGMAGLWGLSRLPPVAFVPLAGAGIVGAVAAGSRRHNQENPVSPVEMGDTGQDMRREQLLSRMYGSGG